MELAHLLKNFKYFEGISLNDLKELASICSLKTINKNNVLIEEGVETRYFYLVLEGSFNMVFRKNLSEKIDYAKIYPGEVIGEILLFNKTVRTASIVARTPAKVIAIPIQRFRKLAQTNQNFANVLVIIAEEMAARLKNSRQKYIGIYKKFHHLNDSMIVNITVISIFIFLVPIIKHLHSNFTYHEIINTMLIGLLGVSTLSSARYAKVNWSDLGLTLKNWRASMIEALIFSAIACLVMLIAKYIALKFYPSFSLAAMLQEDMHDIKINIFVAIAIYSAFSFVQEFIVRGCLQGPMSMLLMGKNIDLKAILISNLLFSSFHVVYSYPLAVLTFIPGLFWGWLYARNRNLIGVSLSHAILGTSALFLL